MIQGIVGFTVEVLQGESIDLCLLLNIKRKKLTVGDHVPSKLEISRQKDCLTRQISIEISSIFINIPNN